jgi:hypothetical protein
MNLSLLSVLLFRWETVHDAAHDRTVTINVDTMRVRPLLSSLIDPSPCPPCSHPALPSQLACQVLGSKACICEFCDAIIEENDLRCFNCNAGRSVKNAPLYRPLGGL